MSAVWRTLSISSESRATEEDGTPSLGWAYRQLRLTGRGKHVGRFSYYHTDLTSRLSSVQASLEATRNRLYRAPFDFNVVKLDRHIRISFLLYEDFTAPFPVLLKTLSCDVAQGTARLADYSQSANPPILHRKELLLPDNDPLVPEAVQLTQRLENLGAFAHAKKIGTRNGWNAALNDLGLTLNGDELAAIPCHTR